MTATAKDLLEYIDKKCSYYNGNGLKFDAVIVDARQVYGKLHFKIMPFAGTGSAWVSSDSIASPTGEVWDRR